MTKKVKMALLFLWNPRNFILFYLICQTIICGNCVGILRTELRIPIIVFCQNTTIIKLENLYNFLKYFLFVLIFFFIRTAKINLIVLSFSSRLQVTLHWLEKTRL